MINYTIEQLNEMSLQDLKNLEEQISQQMNDTNQYQYAIKIAMNSIYGAFCNEGFNYFQSNVAEAITVEGQSLIKYGDRILNEYFQNVWHTDKELHLKMGIEREVIQIEDDVIKYIDTDSVFLCLESIFKNYFPNIDPVEKSNLILEMFEFRLNDYIKSKYEIYAQKHNTKNLQDFELEAIFENGILIKKKRYILNTIWKMPNIHITPYSKLKITGVEMVRITTPLIISDRLTVLIKYMLNNKKENSLYLKDITAKVKEFKKEFMLADISQIVFNSNIREYSQYILEDKKKIVVASGCPIHVRAAANYNFILNKNIKTFGNKYKFITKSNKIGYYYVKDAPNALNNVFAYPLEGDFPSEIAPACDRELMFEKSFLEPLNKFVSIILNGKQVPNNLVTHHKLFSLK